MKKTTIATLLAVVSNLSLSLCAVPLMLHNEYQKTISYKTNVTIENYKAKQTDKDYGTLGWQAEVNLGDLNDINLLEIKGIGAYSSLKKELQQLHADKNNSIHSNQYPTIVILPNQSTTSMSWNIGLQWNALARWPNQVIEHYGDKLNNVIALENVSGYPLILHATNKNNQLMDSVTVNPNNLFILSSNLDPIQYSSIAAALTNRTIVNLKPAVVECENAHRQGAFSGTNIYIIRIHPAGNFTINKTDKLNF